MPRTQANFTYPAATRQNQGKHQPKNHKTILSIESTVHDLPLNESFLFAGYLPRGQLPKF
jgi:hypothetical protein